MKKIEELTEQEAREILEFVYPGKTDLSNSKNYDYWFLEMSKKPIINEDGSQQITFGFRPIIGILYHNGQDRCILHFDNTKVVLWLYKNGYDIEEFLEMNKHLTEVEHDFEKFAFAIEYIKIQKERLTEKNKDKFTVDFVISEIERACKKYFYKDYE